MTVLHLYLEGQGPPPFEHFVGRLCEEFQCLPSAAYREWLRLPAGFLEQVIEYRAYAAAYYVVQSNPRAHGGMTDLVKRIEFDLARAEIDGQ